MAFNGTEGSSITRAEAATMTAADTGAIHAVFFGKDILNLILAQTGCEGIRFYFAVNNGDRTLVAVGASANEDSMVTGVIADYAKPCPTHCGVTSF